MIPNIIRRASSGATGRVLPHSASVGRNLPAVRNLPASTAAGVASNPGSRKSKIVRAMTSKKGMIGMGVGVGALALSRNTGHSTTKPQRRPTGVYGH